MKIILKDGTEYEVSRIEKNALFKNKTNKNMIGANFPDGILVGEMSTFYFDKDVDLITLAMDLSDDNITSISINGAEAISFREVESVYKNTTDYVDEVRAVLLRY